MNVLSIAWKDIQIFLRERGQLIMLFLLPLVFVVVFSAVFELQEEEEKVITLPVVNLDKTGETADNLLAGMRQVGGIEAQAYTEEKAQAELENGGIRRALYIPSDFTEKVAAGESVELTIISGDEDEETETIRAIVDGVARDLSLQTQIVAGLRQMGQMMGITPEGKRVFTPDRIVSQAESQFERAQNNPLVSVRKVLPEVIRRERAEFSAVDLSVPGFTVLFVFLTATATAMSLFSEKKTGSFRRLLAAPVRKYEVLIGKMLPNIITTSIQIAFIFLLSALLLPLIGFGRLTLVNPPALIVISLLVGLCSAALGLFLAALARTEKQITTLGAMILWVMGAVSGAFIPQFVLGGFLGSVGKVVPHYWAIAAYQDVIVRNQGFSGIALELLILGGFTLFFCGVGLWKFRFEAKE